MRSTFVRSLCRELRGFSIDYTFLAYQANSAAWMFGGKDVILDGEGTGTINGNGQVCFSAVHACRLF